MKNNFKFCTLTQDTTAASYICTVKKDLNGRNQPKDIWYQSKWMSIEKFEKEISINYSVSNYRVDMEINWKELEIRYYNECLKNINIATDNACLVFNKIPKELFKWFKINTNQ